MNLPWEVDSSLADGPTEAAMLSLTSQIVQQVPTVEAFFLSQSSVQGWVDVERSNTVGRFSDTVSNPFSLYV